MKIQQFLAPDAVSLSLACSSRPAATPARGFSSCYIPVVIYTCHLYGHRWNCVLGSAAGCRRAGRRARPARLGSLLALAGVCCRGEVLPLRTVLALCFRTTTWFRVAELFLQPGGAYVSLHHSCSGSLFPWKGNKRRIHVCLGEHERNRSHFFIRPRIGEWARPLAAEEDKGLGVEWNNHCGDEEENSAPWWQFKGTLCYYASAVAVLQGSVCVLIVCRGSW